jgi:hypothetical protein
MNIVAFGGSFQDDGVGEDFLPNRNDVRTKFIDDKIVCQMLTRCFVVCDGILSLSSV